MQFLGYQRKASKPMPCSPLNARCNFSESPIVAVPASFFQVNADPVVLDRNILQGCAPRPLSTG